MRPPQINATTWHFAKLRNRASPADLAFREMRDSQQACIELNSGAVIRLSLRLGKPRFEGESNAQSRLISWTQKATMRVDVFVMQG